MKCRKAISVALCMLHLSMIYISCEESTLSTPVKEEIDNTVIASVSDMSADQRPVDPGNILLDHPGLLHNEILRCFNKDGILAAGHRLTREELITRMVQACNQVFMQYIIEHSVAEEDIESALRCLESWGERGIYDIYQPIEGNNIENVYNLLDHLAYEANGFEPEDIEDIKQAFKALEAVKISNCDSRTIRDITSQYKSRDNSSAAYKALDVLEHSYDFWSQLELKENDIDQEYVTATACAFDPKLKIDPVVIGILLADAIGALLCWNGGPLSVICATLASIAYYIIMGDRP